MQSEKSLRSEIKILVIIFISFLILSGVTAFALETELGWLNNLFKNNESQLSIWINKVYMALRKINLDYPFLAYGYDWLAFAHLVIAVAFAGPLRDPVKNKWVLQFGMIACCMIFPLAFIAGHLRKIPFYWQLIDCSFGAIGVVPLYLCYYKINKLEGLIKHN